MAIKSYELRYYKNVSKIHTKYRIKLVRLWLAGKLLKLVTKLSPELIRQYDANVLRKYYDNF